MGLFMIDEKKCRKDGICVSECPLFILELKEKHMALEDPVTKHSGEFHEEGLRFISTRIKSTRVFKIGMAEISGKASR